MKFKETVSKAPAAPVNNCASVEIHSYLAARERKRCHAVKPRLAQLRAGLHRRAA